MRQGCIVESGVRCVLSEGQSLVAEMSNEADSDLGYGTSIRLGMGSCEIRAECRWAVCSRWSLARTRWEPPLRHMGKHSEYL